MAVSSRKRLQAKTPPGRKTPVRLATAQDHAAPSPARVQRDILHDRWLASERHAEPAKWSQRRSAAFIALSCGGFWACVILGATRLAH